MRRRKAFADILAHRTPDQLILDLGGCPLSGMELSQAKVLEYMGFAPGYEGPEYSKGRIDERILAALDIDTRGVGELFSPQKSIARRISDTENIDAWGIRRRFTGIYWDIVDYPLRGATVEDLERYPWPDADSLPMERIERYARVAKYLCEETDFIVCGEHPVYGVFELGCWMCGFEDFMLKLYEQPEFVHRFFEIILAFQKKVIETYYSAIGRYIHFTSSGDDFATQQNSFMSPRMFGAFIEPYFTERIRYTHEFTDAVFLHHSCGNVRSLIPQLMESGVQMLNPIQPTNDDMSPESLKRDFGAKLVFHGGLDTQHVLPRGSVAEVEAEVRRLCGVMAPGGGYVFAAAHNIQPDVPPENLIAMYRAARAFDPKNNTEAANG